MDAWELTSDGGNLDEILVGGIGAEVQTVLLRAAVAEVIGAPMRLEDGLLNPLEGALERSGLSPALAHQQQAVGVAPAVSGRDLRTNATLAAHGSVRSRAQWDGDGDVLAGPLGRWQMRLHGVLQRRDFGIVGETLDPEAVDRPGRAGRIGGGVVDASALA